MNVQIARLIREQHDILHVLLKARSSDRNGVSGRRKWGNIELPAAVAGIDAGGGGVLLRHLHLGSRNNGAGRIRHRSRDCNVAAALRKSANTEHEQSE